MQGGDRTRVIEEACVLRARVVGYKVTAAYIRVSLRSRGNYYSRMYARVSGIDGGTGQIMRTRNIVYGYSVFPCTLDFSPRFSQFKTDFFYLKLFLQLIPLQIWLYATKMKILYMYNIVFLNIFN